MNKLIEEAYVSAAAAKVAAAEAESAKQALLDAMVNRGFAKDSLLTNDGVEVTATVVQSSTVELDWDAIEQHLTTDEWEAIQVTSPSPQKLEGLAVVKESVKKVVADASTEKPRKPYVRISEKRVEEVPPMTSVRKRATKIPKPKTR